MVKNTKFHSQKIKKIDGEYCLFFYGYMYVKAPTIPKLVLEFREKNRQLKEDNEVRFESSYFR